MASQQTSITASHPHPPQHPSTPPPLRTSLLAAPLPAAAAKSKPAAAAPPPAPCALATNVVGCGACNMTDPRRAVPGEAVACSGCVAGYAFNAATGRCGERGAGTGGRDGARGAGPRPARACFGSLRGAAVWARTLLRARAPLAPSRTRALPHPTHARTHTNPSPRPAAQPAPETPRRLRRQLCQLPGPAGQRPDGGGPAQLQRGRRGQRPQGRLLVQQVPERCAGRGAPLGVVDGPPGPRRPRFGSVALRQF